jgi:hypothetical protein
LDFFVAKFDEMAPLTGSRIRLFEVQQDSINPLDRSRRLIAFSLAALVYPSNGAKDVFYWFQEEAGPVRDECRNKRWSVEDNKNSS